MGYKLTENQKIQFDSNAMLMTRAAHQQIEYNQHTFLVIPAKAGNYIMIDTCCISYCLQHSEQNIITCSLQYSVFSFSCLSSS